MQTITNRVGAALSISDKVDFRTRNAIMDKEEHCVMIKGSMLQEDRTINVYAPNNRAANHMKQKLIDLKEQANPQSQT